MVNAKVIKRKLDTIEVNANILLQRVQLETNLLSSLLDLPTFFAGIMCFMVALCTFAPTHRISEVHKHIVTHFGISADDLSHIHNYDQIYDFIEHFEEQNEQMQPTSAKYWCEKRYTQHKWDDHLLLPVYSCPSPRLFALDHNPDPNSAWSVINGSSGSGSSSSSSAGSASSGSSSSGSSHSRRLGSSGSSSGNDNDTNLVRCPSAPTFYDDDVELQAEEGDASLTCQNFQHHVCDVDLGVILCPVTCGYCPPFEYKHVNKFDKPQVTLLPIVVHQTRFVKSECHDFAHTVEHQPYNPDLIILPALDGARNERLLTCIDRTKRFDGPFAHEIKCPETGAPEAFCHGGYMNDSPKHTYHGDPVYAKFMTEPHKQVEAMKTLGWLDLQSEEAVVSTLVYTEGEEIFTSVSVSFSMDFAGNIVPSYELVSYHDLTGESRVTFVATLICVIILALFDVGREVYHLCRHKELCNWGLFVYELVCRITICSYSLILLISWSQQKPMSQEYDEILHTILDFHGHGHAAFEEAVQHYFDAKTHIWGETQWLLKMKIGGYLILYLQFVLIVFYMSAHPRLASLLAIVQRAMGAIMNWLVLFSVVFFLLGFSAFWLLGDYVKDLGNYALTVEAQAKILYGSFVFAKTLDEVSGLTAALYWIYGMVFLLTVTFVLMGMFGGILLNAVFEQAKNTEDNVVENSVVFDIVDTVWGRFMIRSRGYPRREQLENKLGELVQAEEFQADASCGEDDQRLEALAEKWLLHLRTIQAKVSEDSEVETVKIPPRRLMEMFPEQLATEDRLADFLALYYNKCNHILCESPEAIAGRAEQKSIRKSSGSSQHPLAPDPEDKGCSEVTV